MLRDLAALSVGRSSTHEPERLTTWLIVWSTEGTQYRRIQTASQNWSLRCRNSWTNRISRSAERHYNMVALGWRPSCRLYEARRNNSKGHHL